MNNAKVTQHRQGSCRCGDTERPGWSPQAGIDCCSPHAPIRNDEGREATLHGPRIGRAELTRFTPASRINAAPWAPDVPRPTAPGSSRRCRRFLRSTWYSLMLSRCLAVRCTVTPALSRPPSPPAARSPPPLRGSQSQPRIVPQPLSLSSRCVRDHHQRRALRRDPHRRRHRRAVLPIGGERDEPCVGDFGPGVVVGHRRGRPQPGPTPPGTRQVSIPAPTRGDLFPVIVARHHWGNRSPRTPPRSRADRPSTVDHPQRPLVLRRHLEPRQVAIHPLVRHQHVIRSGATRARIVASDTRR